jgi:DNA-binding MurR/RpiR family transcriptional regulator
MRIGEYLEILYETSKKGSADYLISGYLLMRCSEGEFGSLTSIARKLGLSKSTVSAFFSSAGLPGGFQDFLSQAATERGMNVIEIERHCEYIRQMTSDMAFLRAVDKNDCTRLANTLLENDNVIIIGPQRYRDIYLSVICLMRRLGITCRFMPDAMMSYHSEELMNLSDRDLVVFYSPESTKAETEFMISRVRNRSSILRAMSSRTIWFCTCRDGDPDRTQIIPFEPGTNPYERVFRSAHAAGQLFLELVRASGIDPQTKIYVI